MKERKEIETKRTKFIRKKTEKKERMKKWEKDLKTKRKNEWMTYTELCSPLNKGELDNLVSFVPIGDIRVAHAQKTSSDAF